MQAIEQDLKPGHDGALTDMDVLLYLLRSDGEEKKSMFGKVRWREKCPDCGSEFDYVKGYEKYGPICRPCRRKPEKFFIDLWWRQERHKFYSDELGLPLNSYDRAKDILRKINAAIEHGSFDPAKFKREDRNKYALRTRWNVYRDMQTKPGYVDLLRTIEAKVFRHFNPLMSIRNITQVDINLFSEKLLEGGLRDNTAKMYVSILIACLHYSRTQGLTSQHYVIPKFAPAQIAKSRSGKKVKRIPAVSEAFKVFSFIPEKLRLPFLFTATHLCRPNETRALQARDFNFERLVVTIQRGFSGKDILSTSKVGEGEENPTEIPLHPSMVEPLRRICMYLEPQQHVFRFDDGAEFIKEPQFYYAIKKAMISAGIVGTTPYMVLKHAQASMITNSTGDLRSTSKLCRHKSVKTTEIYAARTDIEKLRELQATIFIPPELIPA